MFSAGPVTPADGVGFSDVSQIMRGCTANGLLLQPSRSATAIDRCIASKVFPTAPSSFIGEIYATYTLLGGAGGYFWDHALVAEVQGAVSLSPSDFVGIRADASLRSGGAPSSPTTGTTVAYSINATTFATSTLAVHVFSESQPLVLVPNGLYDFAVWHTAPVFSSGWALLGDLSKYVPTSEQRFSNVQVTQTGATVDVRGSPGESVSVTWWSNMTGTTTTVVCVLTEADYATVSVPSGVCM